MGEHVHFAGIGPCLHCQQQNAAPEPAPETPDIVAVAKRLLDGHPSDCAGCPDCSILIDRNLLGEFAAEIERLTTLNANGNDALQEYEKENAQLSASLRKYGHHLGPGCDILFRQRDPDEPCNCGYLEAVGDGKASNTG